MYTYVKLFHAQTVGYWLKWFFKEINWNFILGKSKIETNLIKFYLISYITDYKNSQLSKITLLNHLFKIHRYFRNNFCHSRSILKSISLSGVVKNAMPCDLTWSKMSMTCRVTDIHRVSIYITIYVHGH
jgi:hypothetical protein